MTTDIRFSAMGTACHLQVDGGPQRAIDAAHARVLELERRWSRFLPESEISMLNTALGEPQVVSSDTARLVDAARAAWTATEGLFDPTVIDSLIGLGYDRSFDELGFGESTSETYPAPGMDGVEIDRATNTIRLPLGVRIDPGGIGKGLAADIVAEELQTAGVTRAVVNLGGDLCVVGSPAVVDVFEPLSGVPAIEVVMENAGLATSTTLRRTWADGSVHHLVDPKTGTNPDHRWTTATVIAGTAWWAEALSKALLIGGPDAGSGAPFMLTGDQQVFGGAFETFMRVQHA